MKLLLSLNLLIFTKFFITNVNDHKITEAFVIKEVSKTYNQFDSIELNFEYFEKVEEYEPEIEGFKVIIQGICFKIQYEGQIISFDGNIFWLNYRGEIQFLGSNEEGYEDDINPLESLDLFKIEKIKSISKATELSFDQKYIYLKYILDKKIESAYDHCDFIIYKINPINFEFDLIELHESYLETGVYTLKFNNSKTSAYPLKFFSLPQRY